MASELKAGSVFNFIRIGMRVGVGLLMIPYLLRCLGPDNYALLALVGGIMGYFALLDFGLSPTVTKYVAEKVALRDKKAEAALIVQCVYLFSGLGLLTAAAAACFYPFLGQLFDGLSAGQLGDLEWMFLIMVAHTVVFFPSRAFIGVLAAHQKFTVPGYVGVASTALTVLCQVALLAAGFGPVALIASDAINSALYELWAWWYRWRISGSSLSFGRPDWRLFGKMTRYAAGIFMQQTGELFLWGSAPVVLGMTAGTASVAVYKVGVQMPSFYMSLPWAITGVLFAKVVGMVTRGAGGAALTDMMVRTGRIQSLIVLLCLFGFLGAGRDFLELWVGASLSGGVGDIWWISMLLMTALAVPLIQSVGVSIVQALELNFGRAVIIFGTSALALVLGAFLSFRWGALGLALGVTAAVALGEIGGVNWFYRRFAGIEVGRFFRQTFRGSAVPCAVTAAFIAVLAYVTREWPHSWPLFVGKAVSIAAVYLPLAWKFWASEDERRMVVTLMPGARRMENRP